MARVLQTLLAAQMDHPECYLSGPTALMSLSLLSLDLHNPHNPDRQGCLACAERLLWGKHGTETALRGIYRRLLQASSVGREPGPL